MNSRIAFDWLDDETCQIWVNNDIVYTMEHGPHGWDGMKGIQEAMTATALALGFAVEVYGEPGI